MMGQRIDKLRILWVFLADAYCQWKDMVATKDLDARYCCDGRECGCYGATVRQMFLPDKARLQQEGGVE